MGLSQGSIRAATAADFELMQDIEVDAGRRFRDVGLAVIADEPPPTAGDLSPYVRSSTAWIALDGHDEAVGYVIASIVDDEAHLDQLSVRVAAQGRGVGTSLIDRVAAWGASHGFEAMTLTTFRDVTFNGPFYRRLGFVEVPETEQGPQLAAIRAQERKAGLDLWPRVAMRRRFGRG